MLGRQFSLGKVRLGCAIMKVVKRMTTVQIRFDNNMVNNTTRPSHKHNSREFAVRAHLFCCCVCQKTGLEIFDGSIGASDEREY